MKKIVYAFLLFILSVSLYSSVFISNADAAAMKPTNCGVASEEGGAVTGSGSTPAHVKVVIWKACDGGYYASAYSTPDSRGWKFAGNLYFGAYTTGWLGDTWQTTSSVNCTGTACDSPELYNVDASAIRHGFYETYNGSFYSCVPSYRCFLPYNLEAD